MVKYFKQLPVATTLEEAHFKIEIFRHFEYQRDKTAIVPHLIHGLNQIQSNNTTRQWISKILNYLARCPIEMVREPLEKLLQERKFSRRLKIKIKGIIMADEENDYLTNLF